MVICVCSSSVRRHRLLSFNIYAVLKIMFKFSIFILFSTCCSISWEKSIVSDETLSLNFPVGPSLEILLSMMEKKISRSSRVICNQEKCRHPCAPILGCLKYVANLSKFGGCNKFAKKLLIECPAEGSEAFQINCKKQCEEMFHRTPGETTANSTAI